MPATEYLPHGFFLSLDVTISCYVLIVGSAPRVVSRIQSNEWSMTFCNARKLRDFPKPVGKINENVIFSFNWTSQLLISDVN